MHIVTTKLLSGIKTTPLLLVSNSLDLFLHHLTTIEHLAFSRTSNFNGMEICRYVYTTYISNKNKKRWMSYHYLWDSCPGLITSILELRKTGVRIFGYLHLLRYQEKRGVCFIIVLWADYLERSMHSDSDWIWFG